MSGRQPLVDTFTYAIRGPSPCTLPTCRFGLTLTVALGVRSRFRLSWPASVRCARLLTLTLPSNTPRAVGADAMHLWSWSALPCGVGQQEGMDHWARSHHHGLKPIYPRVLAEAPCRLLPPVWRAVMLHIRPSPVAGMMHSMSP
jgi:hypothetical protein